MKLSAVASFIKSISGYNAIETLAMNQRGVKKQECITLLNQIAEWAKAVSEQDNISMDEFSEDFRQIQKSLKHINSLEIVLYNGVSKDTKDLRFTINQKYLMYKSVERRTFSASKEIRADFATQVISHVDTIILNMNKKRPDSPIKGYYEIKTRPLRNYWAGKMNYMNKDILESVF